MEVTNVFDNTKRLPYFESSKIPNLCKPCPKYPEFRTVHTQVPVLNREIAIALIVAAGYRVNQLTLV